MSFLEMEDVYKRFGGVRALQGASLHVNAGEVHGLLGPNGSGKSTLNKVLSGTVNPDEASVSIGGQVVQISRPLDAHKQHVASVYQQLSLVPELSVLDNLLLGTEISKFGFVDKKRSRAYAEEALEHFRPGLEPSVTLNTEVSSLSPGSRQLVEIAKAVARKPRILVLDEATASLRSDQVRLLFEMVNRLKEEGVAIVFVSHRLEEVREICQRATILRNGKTVASVDMADMTESQLVRLMVGDLVEEEAITSSEIARPPISDEVQLRVKNLHSSTLRGVDFEVRRGEVIGLGGLQGQGQSELLHVLFGDQQRTSGEIELTGQPLTYKSSRGAIKAGFALVPGDRGSQGLFMKRPILENLSVVSGKKRLVAGWFLNMSSEKAAARREIEKLQVKIGGLTDPVSTLSGGNQQKIVLGKWLMNDPRVVLLDDPTKGVDVGAKAEIYEIIRDLAANGITVILNSSDDRELASMCDRVIVLYEGEVVSVLSGPEVTQDNLVAAALLVSAPQREEEDSHE